jgi:hypothetical protein
MKVNKYLVLHSGDRVLLSKNLEVLHVQNHEQFFKDNFKEELAKHSIARDLQQSASHIELVLTYKDKF